MKFQSLDRSTKVENISLEKTHKLDWIFQSFSSFIWNWNDFTYHQGLTTLPLKAFQLRVILKLNHFWFRAGATCSIREMRCVTFLISAISTLLVPSHLVSPPFDVDKSNHSWWRRIVHVPGFDSSAACFCDQFNSVGWVLPSSSGCDVQPQALRLKISRSNLASLIYSVTAPAIRLVDEMQHEVSDRYYKLGSSVDITCQVALSFLNTIPSPTTNSNDRLLSSLTTTSTTTTTTSTTTIFPFIDINLIKKTTEQHIPYSGKHNIKWRKNGKDLPKDIKINLRFVCEAPQSNNFLSFSLSACDSRHHSHSMSIIIWIIYFSSTMPLGFSSRFFFVFDLRKQHNQHLAK